MSVLTTRNELLTASGLDWLHIVDVSDPTDSPQGTSKKIKLDNIFANYLGFDTRYYTKIEINNFLGGFTSISGYNKNDWDDAFGWGDHSTAGYLESVQGGQGTTIDDSDPVNPLVNLGGTIDDEVIIDLKAQGLGASFSIEDIDEESSKISFDQFGIFLNHSSLISIYSHQINGAVDIKGADVSLQAGATGSMNFLTPDIVNTSSANGRVLTLMDANTGEVEFQEIPDFQLVSEKGVANGYAPLNGSGIIDQSYLPSYVDDVLEYADFASFPASGETGKIYIDLSENDLYRWSGSVYVEVAGTAPTTWGSITGTLSNQTDLQTALNGKVDVAGDTMTGTLTVPQLEMNQSANFFQPTTNNDKILFIGGNGSDDRDWSNIFFYTGGVFRVNGNDIWHSGQTIADYPDSGMKFSNDAGASYTEINSQGDIRTTRDGVCIVEIIGDDNSAGLVGTDTDHDLVLRRNNGEKVRLTSTATVFTGDIVSDSDITATSQMFIGSEFTNKTVGKLQINGDGASQGIVLWNESGAVTKRIWSDAATDRLYITAGATASLGVYMDAVGNFFFQGDVTADDFIQSSDERLKSNIQPLEYKPIKADWKSFEMKDRKRVGVIAQELEKNHPEFVHTNDDGYKSVSYIDLLVAKIHELENRIKQLEG